MLLSVECEEKKAKRYIYASNLNELKKVRRDTLKVQGVYLLIGLV